MAGLVPRGAHGNPVEVPVPGLCGHRYQEASSNSTAETCSCGLFAVGRCAQCQQPRCGIHGSLSGGSFLCIAHIAQAKQVAAQAATQAAINRLAQAQAAVVNEQEGLLRALDGFPAPPASGPAMAQALQRLLPGRTVTFELGPEKRWGRHPKKSAWEFVIGRDKQAEGMGWVSQFLVIDTDGQMAQEAAGWGNYRYRHSSTSRGVSELSGALWRRVAVQVANRLGRTVELSSITDRELVAETKAHAAGRGFAKWPWLEQEQQMDEVLDASSTR